MANLSAFIDQGSVFEGKLSFKDTVRIDGTFSGEIASENTLIVGETGSIEATIRSNTVIVSGTVAGNILAARQIVLHKSARVEGDMTAPSLVIEEGAIFNGQLSMQRPEAKGAAAPEHGSRREQEKGRDLGKGREQTKAGEPKNS